MGLGRALDRGLRGCLREWGTDMWIGREWVAVDHHFLEGTPGSMVARRSLTRGGSGCLWETALDRPLSPHADPDMILRMYDRDHIVVRSGILPSF